MTLRLPLIALAAMLVVPAQAAPAAAAIAAPAPASDLDGLISLLMPEQGVLDLAVTAAGKGLDENNGADFARHPGMRAYVLAQIKPQLVSTFRAALPELRATIGTILSRELTAQEIAELYTFFSSPTGKKLYATMLQVAGETAGESEDAVRQAMMDRVMSTMTPDDYGPLAEFGSSGASAKMQVIAPLITKASTDWTSKLVAANADSMRALRDKAVADYKRQHKVGE